MSSIEINGLIVANNIYFLYEITHIATMVAHWTSGTLVILEQYQTGKDGLHFALGW
jgi:hypothetical protein